MTPHLVSHNYRPEARAEQGSPKRWKDALDGVHFALEAERVRSISQREECEAVERKELLFQLSFGSQVAEDERRELARYFVETDQWRRIFGGGNRYS